MFHSTPITMRAEAREHRWTRGLAWRASLVLHLLIAALLIFGPRESLPQPQEEAISVELVPPPEPSRNGKAEDFPVLKPVVQFGEKDVGPQLSPDGNSANDGSASPTAQHDPDKRDLAQPPAATTVKTTEEAPQPGAPQTPALRPEDAAKAQRASKLRVAKTLFSQKATGDPIATTAMGYVPRDVRVARLCATELKEQLLHGSPSYFPEILPFDRLKEGNVIENAVAAFRSNWEWYDLSYRCEVDTDARKVVRFAFDVGKPLTPEEWRRRGLPSQ
ncbi:protein of unknown function [Rhizobiales bacterium GAS191]|jgi:hypothetical protein|nr:protein of unknown function [Rhizobiales bacterium GAS113]SEC80376.1 protein of unknown function [Rhizobiales bacterium GAS191]